jgi:DNA-binding MarR family transcriptional regulator
MLTLSALKTHLAERRQASLGEIALHFDAEPAAVRDALARFEEKGRVRRLPPGESCHGCSCGCRGGDLWEWLG